jgi:hypothetical protein
MRPLCLLVVSVPLLGCAATSAVIPIGKDTYSIAGHDNGPAASLTSLKVDIYRAAGAHCAAMGKTMKVTGGTDTPRSLGQFPQAEVQFTCV